MGIISYILSDYYHPISPISPSISINLHWTSTESLAANPSQVKAPLQRILSERELEPVCSQGLVTSAWRPRDQVESTELRNFARKRAFSCLFIWAVDASSFAQNLIKLGKLTSLKTACHSLSPSPTDPQVIHFHICSLLGHPKFQWWKSSMFTIILWPFPYCDFLDIYG